MDNIHTFIPSCPPHHQSTTHHQVVGKCNSSEACEFTAENTLGRKTLWFWSTVAWLLGSPKWGLRVRSLIWESAPQKVHGTEARDRYEIDLHFNMLKKLRRRSTLGRWSELAKSARYDFRKKKSKSTSTESSPVSALRERWSIWCDAPAMQVCNRL